jgi:outer membrane biosynthesis protein TonB
MKRVFKTICILTLAAFFFACLFFGCSTLERSLPTEADSGFAATGENTLLPTESEIPTKEPITFSPEPTPEQTPELTEEPTGEPTPGPTEEPTPEPTEEPTPEPTEEPTPTPTSSPGAPKEMEQTVRYVANMNTKKFHYPHCSSVKDIKPSNRWDFYGEREELIQKGYVPCKKCNP